MKCSDIGTDINEQWQIWIPWWKKKSQLV